MQLDMFQTPRLAVRAAKRTEPALWISRLVLWSAPGVVLTDISLRRGLNVVWSPDPSDASAEHAAPVPAAFGHGAGKTLLCRLIRYCLGEATFGTPEQRAKIARAYPDGFVGAEVMIDGIPWAVVRSLGLFPNDRVVRGVPLDRVGEDKLEILDVDTLVRVLETKTIGRASSLVSKAPGRAWLTALAWLSRDQECRLAKITAWRSPISASSSPAEELSSAEASRVLRALVSASSERERSDGAKAAKLATQRKKQETEAGHHRWAWRRELARLASALGRKASDVPDGSLAIEMLRSAALVTPRPGDVDDGKTARASLDHALAATEALVRALEGEAGDDERIAIAHEALVEAVRRLGADAATKAERRRLHEDIDGLAEQLAALEAAEDDVAKTTDTLHALRDRGATLREQSARDLARLRNQFEAVVRRILGDRASADLKLDHNGLQLSLQLGGDQTSPGIESMKIIAFDLAVLCQTIEGNTSLPAFLIHDSPREADLGLSLYHPVFDLARELERSGPSGSEAPFQYIVTTTTMPPAFARQEPVLRATLHGAPPEARLLKIDL